MFMIYTFNRIMSDENKSDDTVDSESKDVQECAVPVLVEKSHEEATSGSNDTNPPMIKFEQEFRSFLELRKAIENYQKEKQIQLIVKDSKLLEAESTRKVI